MARLALPRALSRLRCVRLLQRRWKTKHFVWFAVAFAVMLAMTSLWRDRRIPVIIVEEHHEGQCYELLLKRRFLLRFMVRIYFQTIIKQHFRRLYSCASGRCPMTGFDLCILIFLLWFQHQLSAFSGCNMHKYMRFFASPFQHCTTG